MKQRNGILAGYRNAAGSFNYRGSNAFFWSSSETGTFAWRRFLYYGYASVFRNPFSKEYEFSAVYEKGERCERT